MIHPTQASGRRKPVQPWNKNFIAIATSGLKLIQNLGSNEAAGWSEAHSGFFFLGWGKKRAFFAEFWGLGVRTRRHVGTVLTSAFAEIRMLMEHSHAATVISEAAL